MPPHLSNMRASSRAVRISERIRVAVVTAAEQSVAISSLRRFCRHWEHQPWPQRRAEGGAIVAVAAIVHLLLIGGTAAWTLLIVPMTALVIGLLAMASAWPRMRDRARE